MELIADFLLLAASLCACLYCYVLSIRLRKLKSTRNGIASSLASLSKSVEEAQTTIAHAHLAAEKSVERLGPLLEQGGALEEALKGELAAVEAALDALIAARAEALRGRATSGAEPQTADADEAAGGDAEEAELATEAAEQTPADAEPETSPSDDDESFEVEWKPEDDNAEGDAPSGDAVARDVISLSEASA